MEPLELENNLKTDVELLKKDVHSIARLVDKLDVAIDKLTDVTNCLNKMIAVQEQKIEQQEMVCYGWSWSRWFHTSKIIFIISNYILT